MKISAVALLTFALLAGPLASGKTIKDVEYGSDPAQRMDIYSPDDARLAPVVFLVHGGGWRRGDKAMSSVTKNKVARWQPRGLIVISSNYRLLPAANPLEQADDLARAIAHAQRHAASWGGDPNKFILMGHSAGAHLVSLLNAQPERALKLGARPWLGSVALDSGGFDIVQRMEARHPKLYDDAFGSDPQFWRQASPQHVITSAAKPLLAVCSTTRPDDPCSQAYAYAAKAATMLTRVTVLEQKLSHRQINAQLGEPGAYTDAVESFMSSLDPRVRQLLARQ